MKSSESAAFLLLSLTKRKFDFVGQRDEVATGFIKATVETGEIPETVFVLVSFLRLINHEATFFAKRLKMTALLLVPSAHLIAHGLHLLG